MQGNHECARRRTVVHQNVKGETSAAERLDKLPHRFQGSQVHVDELGCSQKKTTHWPSFINVIDADLRAGVGVERTHVGYTKIAANPSGS